MPLDVPKLALLKLAGLLIFTNCLLAGDQPPDAGAYAPPERFSTEQRGHWAYQPVKEPEPPSVKEASWVRESDRSVHPGRARGPGTGTFTAGEPGCAGPPGDVRLGRPAPFATRGECIPG